MTQLFDKKMSEIINKFKITNKINYDLKQKIKLFHFFDDQIGDNVLFVTNDDKVFTFGQNSDGCCGLGHNSVVTQPQEIPELSHKNIKQFFNGLYFVLTLTNDNHLYGWGTE